ncbi:MAG: glycosyltransferase [Verrucomicrobiota bacterium]|jgi:glycosyltransferase involved in cell wall biosynthesis|nr:glycosyltransferase [Verrucomicrobiota bacterium]
MSREPSVDVVIPAYRCAGTIGQVLDALLAQSHLPARIIVVNDASPDSLPDVLAAYDNRVEVITNEVNLGLAKSYNVGLRRVEAPYAMTLHSDCVLEAGYIRNLVRILEATPSAAVATGQYLFADVDRMSFADRLYLALNLIPREPAEQGVQPISFIEGKADLFRLEDLKAVNFFDEHFVLTSEDQDISARLRARNRKLVQDSSSRFTSAFGGTQDTVAKVIRKQRTYARGQAFIALKYGKKAYERTTPNRNHRAWHRVFQLFFTALGFAMLVLSMGFPLWLWVWMGWVGVRYLTYLALCLWVGFRDVWAVSALGVWSDVWYAVGFMEGLIKVTFLGRT